MSMKPSTRIVRAAALAALLVAATARVQAAGAGDDDCVVRYPFQSADPRTNVVFNEPEILRAFSPTGHVTATPGLTIKAWYNDGKALLLGIRRVVVKTRSGTTTTDYDVSPLPHVPAGVTHPKVGTTALDGDQAGTDVSSCSGSPDLCDRPIFPALFITDITNDPTSTAGDWQRGGTPIPPHAVFGTWKAAVRTVDKTKSPAVITITPDADPANNDWNLDGGDPAPAGLENDGHGAEVRWSIDELIASDAMVPGHTYRLQFMVHDGDQNKPGGDVGQGCVNVLAAECAHDADCNDHDACTTDRCSGGMCANDPKPDCESCETASDCDDDDVCTTEQCNDGVCAHTPIDDCEPCTTAGDCDDQNACTNESCVDGRCRHAVIDFCEPCTTAGDCNDDDPCTSEACTAGVCEHSPISGCQRCTTPADCDDQDMCTTEACVAGVCEHTGVSGCRPCTTLADCDDGNACTTESCPAGVCEHATIAGCQPCTTPEECDDHDACTSESCSDGVCQHTPIPSCRPCTTAGDCDDANACTTDSCPAGTCVNAPIAGCQACSTDADCNDQNACTTDACPAGVCQHVTIADCQPCTRDPDCDDADPCTTDKCPAGRCVHQAILNCVSPLPAEICGDCIDNDGNGLTDFEDPACCQQQFNMALALGRIKPRGATSKLRIHSQLAQSGLADVDPTKQDVFVQIRRPGSTDLLCAKVPATSFMHMHRTFKYWGRKHPVASAKGLDDLSVIVKRNRSVRFKTVGRKVQMSGAGEGNLQLTVGFHDPAGTNRCSTLTQPFRTGRNGKLIAP